MLVIVVTRSGYWSGYWGGVATLTWSRHTYVELSLISVMVTLTSV